MTAQNERYYGLDALRGSMMLLGIVLHAATFHLMEIGAIDRPTADAAAIHDPAAAAGLNGTERRQSSSC